MADVLEDGQELGKQQVKDAGSGLPSKPPAW
jgi:hypothetical protein